jgi:pimeloyl-ACP methyl ester carboxylesterase
MALQTTHPEIAAVRGMLMLAAEAFDHLTARVHEFHSAVSDMPFKGVAAAPGLGLAAQPVRTLHDAITDGVYGAIRLTGAALLRGATQALEGIERNPALKTLPQGKADAGSTALQRPAVPSAAAQLVSVVNGFVGDHMARRRNPLSVRMGFHRAGVRLALEHEALRSAFPSATSRLAVFVHGLCCTEQVWSLYGSADDPESIPYGERLYADLGYTPLYLRYNSGLHVSLNGRSFSRLLDRLIEAWPVKVEEIVLVGHSMGGLVGRAAAEAGRRNGARWAGSLSQVVCLGTPHLGAPLEKLVHLGAAAMRLFPLSRPVARLLDSRSLGIKDLRFGYVADEDWKGLDPDAPWQNTRCTPPALPGVRYRFIGSALGASPDHPLTQVLGDGLVRVPSSMATALADADGALRLQLHHLRLLNHPDVYAQLRSWLSEPPSLR